LISAGALSRPSWGAYSITPTLLLDLRGPTSKGMQWRNDARERQGRGGKGEEEKEILGRGRREGKGRGLQTFQICHY